MNNDAMKETMMETLVRLASLLDESEPSAYANKTPHELAKVVASNLASMKSSGVLSDSKKMNGMFLPTASLQDIAMDNGWGDQYLALASQFDTCLKACR